IELYPGTNVRLPKKSIMMAIAKANNNPRAMVRNIFLNIISEKELMKYRTAEEVNRLEPNIQLAITEYLKIRENVEISNKMYTEVINKKMQHLKAISKLTPNEVERSLTLKRERVKDYRMKRKLEQKNDSVSKICKTKTVNDGSSQVEESANTATEKDAMVSQHLMSVKNINETPPEARSLMSPMRDHSLMTNNPQQYLHCHGSPSFGFQSSNSFHGQQYQSNYQYQSSLSYQPLDRYEPPPNNVRPSFSNSFQANTDHPNYINL
ncbi:hypothetical protein PV326_013611, partial [Microctonus aethiopoides]